MLRERLAVGSPHHLKENSFNRHALEAGLVAVVAFNDLVAGVVHGLVGARVLTDGGKKQGLGAKSQDRGSISGTFVAFQQRLSLLVGVMPRVRRRHVDIAANCRQIAGNT
jgi:hypothetical protein